MIAKVSMQTMGVWTVQYVSGRVRKYDDSALPKSVQDWLAENPESRKAADRAMKWAKESEDHMEIYWSVKGQGRGSGKPYAEQIRRLPKAMIIWMAEGAGMVTKRPTEKAALAYLL